MQQVVYCVPLIYYIRFALDKISSPLPPRSCASRALARPTRPARSCQASSAAGRDVAAFHRIPKRSLIARTSACTCLRLSAYPGWISSLKPLIFPKTLDIAPVIAFIFKWIPRSLLRLGWSGNRLKERGIFYVRWLRLKKQAIVPTKFDIIWYLV